MSGQSRLSERQRLSAAIDVVALYPTAGISGRPINAAPAVVNVGAHIKRTGRRARAKDTPIQNKVVHVAGTTEYVAVLVQKEACVAQDTPTRAQRRPTNRSTTESYSWQVIARS